MKKISSLVSGFVRRNSRTPDPPAAGATLGFVFRWLPGLRLAPRLAVGALLPLLAQVQAQAPAPAPKPAAAPAPDPAGISAPWDISQTVAALMGNTARLRPLLDQVMPREWVRQGAPEAYVAQWQSAEQELTDVARIAQNLEKQPERLTVALDTYFRLQSLETRLNSLVDGVRRYQNPAVGDLLVSVLGESASNREKLRAYIADLATQKEQEFSIADKEAQRCRTNLNRQPPPRPAKAAPKQNP